MKKIGFVIFMSLVVFAGCRETQSNNEQVHTIQDYFPLKVGDMWVYKGNYDIWSNDHMNDSVWTSIETLKVVAESYNTFVIEHTHRDSSDKSGNQITTYIDTCYYQVRYTNDVLPESELFSGSTSEGWFCVLKEPLEKGNNWGYDGTTSAEEFDDYVEVDSIGFECTISEVIFKNCLSIHSYFPNNGSEVTIYSLGVGKVEDRESWGGSSEGGSLGIQLISYKLK